MNFSYIGIMIFRGDISDYSFLLEVFCDLPCLLFLKATGTFKVLIFFFGLDSNISIGVNIGLVNTPSFIIPITYGYRFSNELSSS